MSTKGFGERRNPLLGAAVRERDNTARITELVRLVRLTADVKLDDSS
jgi:hypothetical protein